MSVETVFAALKISSAAVTSAKLVKSLWVRHTEPVTVPEIAVSAYFTPRTVDGNYATIEVTARAQQSLALDP